MAIFGMVPDEPSVSSSLGVSETIARFVRTVDPIEVTTVDERRHETRLVPLLLHEVFTGDQRGWETKDDPGVTGSSWSANAIDTTRGVLRQTAAVGGTGADTPGTTYEFVKNQNLSDDDPSQPVRWSDYAVTLMLRPGQSSSAVGVVFRRISDNTYYLYTMSVADNNRRLVRVQNGMVSELAQENGPVSSRDYNIHLEAVGAEIRIYEDDTLVFSITDEAPLSTGGIGCFCRNDSGAEFSDIRVHDFSVNAPVAYRFAFTTSQFVNFYHQLHSYQDETWQSRTTQSADLATN